jgi:hypothetical protein
MTESRIVETTRDRLALLDPLVITKDSPNTAVPGVSTVGLVVDQ